MEQAQPIDDRELTKRVAKALRERLASRAAPIESYGDELIVRGIGIRVRALAGTVRLMGVLENAALVKRAEETAKSTMGVRKVDNKLVTGGMLEFD